MIRVFAGVLIAALLFVASVRDARADIIVFAEESAGDVIFTGGGTANLAGLTTDSFGAGLANIIPSEGGVLIGIGPEVDFYDTISGPASFGPGGFILADTSVGDFFGVFSLQSELIVPRFYISGTPLAGTSRFVGQSFASLGLIPGTYIWTWGAGANADSFTLQIGPAVPEPAVALLAVLGLAARAVRRRQAR